MRSAHDFALEYADLYGLAPIPLRKDGRPLQTGYLRKATADSYRFSSIWDGFDGPLGVVLGSSSGGICVLDIDPRNGGRESLDALIKQCGDLPATPLARTKRGGSHYFFRWDAPLRTKNGVRPGIDFLAEGSFVRVEPSTIEGGDGSGTYRWLLPPKHVDFAPLPPEIIAYLGLRSSKRSRRSASARTRWSGEPFELPDAIPVGTRNRTLFTYACSLRGKGYDRSEILREIQRTNGARCARPLDHEDLRKISDSACRYKAGDGRVRLALPARRSRLPALALPVVRHLIDLAQKWPPAQTVHFERLLWTLIRSVHERWDAGLSDPTTLNFPGGFSQLAKESEADRKTVPTLLFAGLCYGPTTDHLSDIDAALERLLHARGRPLPERPLHPQRRKADATYTAILSHELHPLWCWSEETVPGLEVQVNPGLSPFYAQSLGAEGKGKKASLVLVLPPPRPEGVSGKDLAVLARLQRAISFQCRADLKCIDGHRSWPIEVVRRAQDRVGLGRRQGKRLFELLCRESGPFVTGEDERFSFRNQRLIDFYVGARASGVRKSEQYKRRPAFLGGAPDRR